MLWRGGVRAPRRAGGRSERERARPRPCRPLLALARRRAANLGLRNASFRECDATAAGLESGSFDAVVRVFGVFFAADMAAFVGEMWRLLRPGGTLAITTWGPGSMPARGSLTQPPHAHSGIVLGARPRAPKSRSRVSVKARLGQARR